MQEKNFVLHERISENVFLINNVSLRWKDVELIFTTLWSHISPDNEHQISRSLNDFHLIRMGRERFRPNHFNMLHAQSRKFIETSIEQKSADKRIIITHYVPSLLHYPEKYIGSPLNQAFVVELDDLIMQSEADYWIYGHHHSNIPEFLIGKTKLVNNQLGYVQMDEHRLFRQDAVIEF